MRHFYIGSLALILLLAWPSDSLADGIATSSATLDWTGFTFTVTSGFTFQDPFSFAFSFASTTLGGQSVDDPFPPGNTTTSAFSQYSTSTGSGVAQAATANGFLTASSQASTTSLQPSINFAESEAFTARGFFPDGGVGTLTISVPFTLSVACASSRPPGSPSLDLTTVADASVELRLIEPGIPELVASDTISCQNNPGLTSGVLTVSENFTTPTFEPVEIFARA